MSLFTIDGEKCNRDRLCVENCPAQIIILDDTKEVPYPSADAEQICIRCGHCVAICPTGAFSHRRMTPEECSFIQRDLLPRPEQVEQLMRSRRSIRTYSDQLIDRQHLLDLIKSAAYAPTGGNSQPVQWHIIYDPTEVQYFATLVINWMRHTLQHRPKHTPMLNFERLVSVWDSGIDRICRGAPHVVVAHAPKEHRSALSSCTIALTYLELLAYSAGFAACWAGYFMAAANAWTPMMKALNLPKGHRCFGALMLGYPKYRYRQIPLRNPPKITWYER